MLMAGGPQAGQHGDDVPLPVTSPGGLGPSRGPAGAPNACSMMWSVITRVKHVVPSGDATAKSYGPIPAIQNVWLRAGSLFAEASLDMTEKSIWFVPMPTSLGE